MKVSPAIAASALALVLALALQTPSPATAAPLSASGDGFAGNPVLFVHGWNSSGSVWNTMADRFRADGWPDGHLKQWSYDTARSNATTAAELGGQVDDLLAATGADQVDVVTHSMGGLSSRYYARNLDGAVKIDAWVSLGGPNHGTDTAYGCFDTSCYEMRPGSDFLTGLNSGDETPGTARYATWWSPCDTVINPDSSVALSGAANARTACLSHSGLLEDATVYTQVRDLIDR